MHAPVPTPHVEANGFACPPTRHAVRLIGHLVALALALAVAPALVAPRSPALAARSPLGPLRAAALNDAATVAAPAARALPAAAAAVPPAVLTFDLYADRLALTTELRPTPTVSLLDAHGDLVAAADISPSGEGGSGITRRWVATLPRGDGTQSANAVIEPGQTIVVQVGDANLRLVVPAIDVAVDAPRHTIAGRAPWPGPVQLQLDDQLPFSRMLPEAPSSTTAAPDGAFRFDFDPATDIGAGVVATVSVVHPDGHRIAASTAAPAVIVKDRGAIVLAPHGARPALSFRDSSGEAWRSDGAGWGGAAQYAFLFDTWIGGDHMLFEPRADMRVRLELGGVVVADEPVNAPTWRFEPEVGRLEGRALPDARILYVGHLDGGPRRAYQQAGPDGAFALRGLGVGSGWTPTVTELWSSARGLVTFYTRVDPTSEAIDLYGHRMALSTSYRADLDATYTAHTGAAPIVRRVARGPRPVNFATALEFAWYDDAGQPIVIAPGDRIELRRADGFSETLAVPSIRVDALGADDRVEGRAMPEATVSATIWPDAGDALSPAERLLPTEDMVFVRTAVDPDGRFTLRCPWPCDNMFAQVNVYPPFAGVGTGRTRYRLYAIGRTFAGAAVSVGALRGFANAGTAVTATLLDARGAPTDVRRAVSGPPGKDRLPRWTIDWRDRFPDGIRPGTRFDLDVAGRPAALEIPRVTIDADVLTDIVRGSAPAGATVEVWAMPNLAVDAMRKPTKAIATVGTNGAWAAAFEGFNLRAEDDLVVNVLPLAEADGGEGAGRGGEGAGAGRTFYQFDVGHVAGEPEATPGPTPTPTAVRSPMPAASATRTATHTSGSAAGTTGRVFLPLAMR